MSQECPACGDGHLMEKNRIGKSRNYTSREYWHVCSNCDYSTLFREENSQKVFPENPRSEWTCDTNMTRDD